jgi:hypothetical protein
MKMQPNFTNDELFELIKGIERQWQACAAAADACEQGSEARQTWLKRAQTCSSAFSKAFRAYEPKEKE